MSDELITALQELSLLDESLSSIVYRILKDETRLTLIFKKLRAEDKAAQQKIIKSMKRILDEFESDSDEETKEDSDEETKEDSDEETKENHKRTFTKATDKSSSSSSSSSKPISSIQSSILKSLHIQKNESESDSEDYTESEYSSTESVDDEAAEMFASKKDCRMLKRRKYQQDYDIDYTNDNGHVMPTDLVNIIKEYDNKDVFNDFKESKKECLELRDEEDKELDKEDKEDKEDEKENELPNHLEFLINSMTDAIEYYKDMMNEEYQEKDPRTGLAYDIPQFVLDGDFSKYSIKEHIEIMEELYEELDEIIDKAQQHIESLNIYAKKHAIYMKTANEAYALGYSKKPFTFPEALEYYEVKNEEEYSPDDFEQYIERLKDEIDQIENVLDFTNPKIKALLDSEIENGLCDYDGENFAENEEFSQVIDDEEFTKYINENIELRKGLTKNAYSALRAAAEDFIVQHFKHK